MPIIKSEDYNAEDYDFGPMSQRQAENLAKFIEGRLEERMYAKLGREGLKKLLWLLGAASLAIGSWLMEWIHFGPK